MLFEKGNVYFFKKGFKGQAINASKQLSVHIMHFFTSKKIY